MSLCHCSLCEEVLTSPVFYKGAPYGWSCINKAIAIDNVNPDAVRKAKKSINKPNGDIYLTFSVDRVEKINFDGFETINVWSSAFGKGKFDLKNWRGDGYTNLGQSVRFNEEKNILIINFGNASYNRRERRSNWKWKHDVLVRHGLLVYSEEHHAWIQNKNLN
jgi:hypothetical protein